MNKVNPPSAFAQNVLRNSGTAIPRADVASPGHPMLRQTLIDPTVPKRVDGPLGMKNISQATADKLNRLNELMAIQNAEVPQEMRSDAREPVPQIPDSPVSTAEAEQEMPENTEHQESPVPMQSPPTFRRDGPLSPMEIIAASGTESRASPSVLGDLEYFNTILWKASPERRKYFEEHRCRPIVWDNMLLTFEVTQEVLVWTKPTDLWVDFRTMTADDEFLSRKILEKVYGLEGPTTHMGNILTAVAAGCNNVGNLKLPSIPPVGNTKEEVRLAAMKSRIGALSRLPHTLLADIAINYTWFLMRVARELRDGETLKNG